MNILITSGSTNEFIDENHYIGNVGDGSFGSIIGEEFSKLHATDKVFYVYNNRSRYPWQHFSNHDQKFFLDDWLDKISLHPIEDAKGLEETIVNIYSDYKIDAVIHLMSIPNYANSKIYGMNNSSDAYKLIQKIAMDFDLDLSLDLEDVDLIETNQLHSGYEKVFIEQTPSKNILDVLKSSEHPPFIIGSKIESGHSNDNLIIDANDSLINNDIDYVIAININDYKYKNNESSFLVNKDKSYSKFETIDGIAQKLTEIVDNKDI